MKTKFELWLYSKDYYSNEDSWTFTLPKTVTTLDEAKKWAKDHLQEILEPTSGGTWISKTHFRFDRGQCQGNATYELAIRQFPDENTEWSEFVKEWNDAHPNNRPF